jgi:protein ImuA
MTQAAPRRALDALRARIAEIEAGGRAPRGVLPFGVPAIDARLPDGGLALGALQPEAEENHASKIDQDSHRKVCENLHLVSSP